MLWYCQSVLWLTRRQGSPESPRLQTERGVSRAWRVCDSVRLSSHTRGMKAEPTGDLEPPWYLQTRGWNINLALQFGSCSFWALQGSYLARYPGRRSLCLRWRRAVWGRLRVHSQHPRVTGWHYSSSQLEYIFHLKPTSLSSSSRDFRHVLKIVTYSQDCAKVHHKWSPLVWDLLKTLRFRCSPTRSPARMRKPKLENGANLTAS